MKPAISPDGANERRKTAVLDAMGRILQSDVIGERSRLRRLLRYIVTEELEGRGDALKAYSLGVDVLGRAEDFDPVADSVVRVEMNRLRQALRQYYAEYGGADPVRIDVPRGVYRPRIIYTAYEKADAEAEDDDAEADDDRGPSPAKSGAKLRLILATVALVAVVGGLAFAWFTVWRTETPQAPPTESITLTVADFRSLSRDAAVRSAALGLSSRLTAALSRNKTLTVISRRGGASPDAVTALYELRGSVRPAGARAQVVVELVEAKTHAVLWARTYRRSITEIAEDDADLVRSIVQELRLQITDAAKLAGAARDPATLSAWELYLQATWAPGSQTMSSLDGENTRIALAERALAIDPDLGEAHSVLADRYAHLANVDPPSDTPARRAAAAFHAQKAIELAPSNPDAMFNLTAHYFHTGDLPAFRRSYRRVLELDPNHLLAKLGPPAEYSCARPPAGVLQNLIDFDAGLAQDNPARWIILALISTLQINLGDYESAAVSVARSHQIYATIETRYRFAALLHHLGRTDEAIAEIEAQRENWPNLDPRHYADTVIPRRCAGRELAKDLQSFYAGFADAWAAR